MLGIPVFVLVAAGVVSTAAWEPLTPGAEHRALHAEQFTAELLRFDLERFRLGVTVPGPDHPVTATQALGQAGAVAAINGGFFDTSGRSLGLRIHDGKVLIPLRARVDWGVLAVRDRRAEIVHSRDYRADPAVTAAVQVGPRLLVGGKPLKLKPQRAARTAVALDRTGRYLTLVVTRDRVEANDLARALAELGFDSALMLDGGPSTQLAARIGKLELDLPGGYGVPDAVLVLPRSRP